jgi:DNA-binding transcriptional regulator GbsR (MarR family)
VSNSLRELQGWGVVRLAHVLGDRRDHFESLKDVWQMFDIIVAERKRREVDPTVEMLRASLVEARQGKDAHVAERIGSMLEFFESMMGVYQDLQRLPKCALPVVSRLRGKLRKLVAAEGGRK